MTASILKQRSKHKKAQTNAYLFEHRHTVCQIFREIPFIKPQNDT